MRPLVFAISGLAVLAASFFGTLQLLDSLPVSFSMSVPFQSLDAMRIAHARTIKAALENYRAARGRFPYAYPNNDLADLKTLLVDGGYIAELPVDPYWKNGRVNKYRYRSLDGASYGVLLYLELGPCQTGIGPAATGPWGGQTVTACSF